MQKRMPWAERGGRNALVETFYGGSVHTSVLQHCRLSTNTKIEWEKWGEKVNFKPY